MLSFYKKKCSHCYQKQSTTKISWIIYFSRRLAATLSTSSLSPRTSFRWDSTDILYLTLLPTWIHDSFRQDVRQHLLVNTAVALINDNLSSIFFPKKYKTLPFKIVESHLAPGWNYRIYIGLLVLPVLAICRSLFDRSDEINKKQFKFSSKIVTKLLFVFYYKNARKATHL